MTAITTAVTEHRRHSDVDVWVFLVVAAVKFWDINDAVVVSSWSQHPR